MSTAIRHHEPDPPRRRRRRRRRIAWPPRSLVAVIAAGVAIAAVVVAAADKAVQEVTLPLRHEDIIRQQAADKGLDPALIAGVIFTESRFRDQTSHAGAKGLMQHALDRRLHRPQVGRHGVRGGRPRHPAGQHRLRLVLPALPARPYGGNEVLAIAAYNAGEGRRRPVVFERPDARRGVRPRAPHPVPRDAHYVEQVLEARGKYRERVRRRSSGSDARAARARHRRGPARGIGSHRAGCARAPHVYDGEPHAVFTAAQRWPGRPRRFAHSRPTSPTRGAGGGDRGGAAALGHVDVLVANHAASVDGAARGDDRRGDRPRARGQRARDAAARAGLRGRLRRRSQGGRVILLTSGQGRGPMAREVPYATSKAALSGITLRCRPRWRRAGSP